MLYLIGIGISDDKDITLRAIDAMKKCEKVYCELYTNVWHGDLRAIEKRVKKKIAVIDRDKVESDFLLDEATKNDIALLIPGDPLTATTHIELMLEAKSKNINVEIVHAPSIFTAIARTGLQLYKFGRTTTLPRAQKNFKPTSPIDAINENRKMGLHTLVLLDIGMTAAEALKELRDALGDIEAVACCNISSADEVIKYGKMSKLEKAKELAATPAVIVIPGALHFKEQEALALWK